MARPKSGEPVLIEDGDLRVEVCCECGLAHFKVYRFKLIDGKYYMEMLTFKDDHETDLARMALKEFDNE